MSTRESVPKPSRSQLAGAQELLCRRAGHVALEHRLETHEALSFGCDPERQPSWLVAHALNPKP